MVFSSFETESFTEESIHRVVRDFLKDEKRGLLLDIGAGTGALSKKLKDDGFDVVACDLYKKNFIPKDIPFEEVDLNKTFPFEENSFDYVTGTEIIEHLENPWHFIRELYRITKPNGVVILSTPNLHNWYVRLIFLLTSKLYNFLSSYEKIGHITPVFIWNLKRMAENKFKFQAIRTNNGIIPGVNIPVPLNGVFFGQCVLVKMVRESNSNIATYRQWYN